MDSYPSTIGLEGITEEDATAQFDALQQKLVPLWHSIQSFNQEPQTIVVVPSMTLDRVGSGARMQAFEERFLFLLLLLAQPLAQLVYVTSQTILPSVIEYYLGLLPGVIPSHARRRLHLVAPLDGAAKPLSLKLLERPALLARIRGLIADPDRAHLVAYNTTFLERNVALRLGIPMYGADPKHFSYGTKSGCRELFTKAGVSFPLGRENLSDIDGLLDALADMRAQKPGMREVVVKINEGVSGSGNSLVDLAGLPAPGDPGERAALAERLRAMRFELTSLTYDEYLKRFAQHGGIVEERVGVGAHEIRSPSVQLRNTPLGKVELLSTHDQMLGGPSGQSYLGCLFPADRGYAAAITREAAKVGALLAEAGVIGRFALDFVVTRDGPDEPWQTYAIEVNLRKGGTTHPFLTLQFLTGGVYDADTALFTAPSGRQKFLIATDHLASQAYRGFTPDDLFDLAVRHGLHYGQVGQTGIVFHMLPALGEVGRTGMTAVGNSPGEAREIYDRAVAAMNKEAATMWDALT
jgi:hypothetical protein